MRGDVYPAANGTAAHAPIGRYQETLTPILMDITGDSLPDFVGTQGVATFTFFVGAPQHVFGSITTTETSYIQGVTLAGQLLVGSQGTIIDSTRALSNLSGEFVSQSTVGLSPSFEMQTYVHFTVNRPVVPVFTVLALAADLDSASDAKDSCQNGDHASEAVLPQNNGSSDHANREDLASGADDDRHEQDPRHNSKLDADSARHETHDCIFADDVDWRPGNSHQDLALV
jgi:hypothetical protein